MDGEISAEELQELLEAKADVRIVDIRSPAAFRRGHIPTSENVPFGELTARIEDIADAERVVTVCPHGQASQQAARLIGSYEGFSGRVDSLEPGIEGWPYDLETDGGTDEQAEETAEEGPEAPF
ncbi:rhodanese-like domain-containing protein [Natronomonas sp.]|uniref:rhodanese-like domain-containing protein n=1 Tax=Natronomonas sp. TaxID=2184060 RepID=UPI002FC37E59